jgi:hypothetical protein
LSFFLVGATCGPQVARPKPKKFDLKFTLAPALVGASVRVDIIGASARSYLPSLETISPGQYWSPDNPVRRDVPKVTLVFERGGPQVQTFPSTDQKWTSWLAAGAEVLVVMVDAPGLQSKPLIVELDQRQWGNTPVLEFLIQESGIHLVTAKPVK